METLFLFNFFGPEAMLLLGVLYILLPIYNYISINKTNSNNRKLVAKNNELQKEIDYLRKRLDKMTD